MAIFAGKLSAIGSGIAMIRKAPGMALWVFSSVELAE